MLARSVTSSFGVKRPAGEASEIAEFGDQPDGGDQVNAAQRHQRPDDRLQAPLSHLVAQRGRDSFDPFVKIKVRCRTETSDSFRPRFKAATWKLMVLTSRKQRLVSVERQVFPGAFEKPPRRGCPGADRQLQLEASD